MRALVWFRGEDVRIADHEPLLEAASEADSLVCLFVLEPRYFAGEGPGRAPHRLQFLLESLASLRDNLRHLGSDLWLVDGPATEALPALAAHFDVDAVYAQATVQPGGRARDAAVAQRLRAPLRLLPGQTLLPADAVCTQGGSPYAVYTPFAKAARAALDVAPPRRAPRALPPPPDAHVFEGLRPLPSLQDLGLDDNPHVQRGGERNARERLGRFLEHRAAHYAEARDRLDQEGTSRLSADLKFGTLSIRTIYHAVSTRMPAGRNRDRMQAELLWREFAHYTLWHRPELLREPFRQDFSGFPWQDDDTAFDAWWEGKTGYPVVDAAARQLLREGYVHNRARMISASFLTKHLLCPYWRGEAHYLRYLTDGDPAQNNLGWQWSAGCGCDAQPYFRVFNPMTQGSRFDPEGEYVRRYVPELADLPTKHIHAPWEAPARVLEDAGVRLGDTYPQPIVDHREARERFLAVARDHLKKE